ncbi:MAG: hypothetical protein ACRCVT_09340 [Leadbetterella sp.]
MKRLNLFMLVQWLVFVPIIIPISIVIGAFEGIKMTFDRASSDIYGESEIA